MTLDSTEDISGWLIAEIEAAWVLVCWKHLADREAGDWASKEIESELGNFLDLSSIACSREDSPIPERIGLPWNFSAGIDDRVVGVVGLKDAEESDNAWSEGDGTLSSCTSCRTLDEIDCVSLSIVLRVEDFNWSGFSIKQLVSGLTALAVLESSTIDSAYWEPSSSVLWEVQIYLDGRVWRALGLLGMRVMMVMVISDCYWSNEG